MMRSGGMKLRGKGILILYYDCLFAAQTVLYLLVTV